MAVKITFDSMHNAEMPTFVLGTRNGELRGKLPVRHLQFRDRLNSASVARFDVYRSDFQNARLLWEDLVGLKLAWVKEWNLWFELDVETTEKDAITKSVTATSLGEAELSQVNLYNYQINTEEDIERDDYKPTVLYDPAHKDASLLHRIMEKVPHYSISHVDSTIANIQRTFAFNEISIYDAFQEISDEIDCLFQIRCYSDSDEKIKREISVFDLRTNCNNPDCGHRGIGSYNGIQGYCEECGGSDLTPGYGDDTTVFINNENLANEIVYTTDIGAVKNCFRLEAGDDLMTATIANCNPNGSPYIWYISDETKTDMSDALQSRLFSYNFDYKIEKNNREHDIANAVLVPYNALVEKYKSSSEKMKDVITGYPDLMKEYYNAIDFYLLLRDTFMPTISIPDTKAVTEILKLNHISEVAVQNPSTCSPQTATNAVEQMAKIIVDGRYRVSAKFTSFSGGIWSGNFTITNYADDEDKATSNLINIPITGATELFIKQKLDKALNKNVETIPDIIQLFDMSETNFGNELKKYCLSRLNSFMDSCQSCIDLMIEQGIAKYTSASDSLYQNLYLPFYRKLIKIRDEIKVRESELTTLNEMQTYLQGIIESVQESLDFEKYLGENLWKEFCAYRREDTYVNQNYISDGLNNAELIERATEFIDNATKEIYKSATLQHSIKADLKNLLLMREFEPIVDYFEVGNWLRIRIDGIVYLLRLIEYNIDFDNPMNLDVVFSDVKNINNGLTDIESVQQQAKTMATSYGSVTRQANKGKKSKDRLDDWVKKGLALTNMKIVDDADNQNITWDNHGILCTEYLPIEDDYDKKQLKIINKGLYVTDDGWETSKAGIGNFLYYDPSDDMKIKEAYGVIAETLVGNLVLAEGIGIYNKNNNMTLDENGFTITTDGNEGSVLQPIFTIRKRTKEDGMPPVDENMLTINGEGDLELNGNVKINSGSYGEVKSIDGIMKYSNTLVEISEKEIKTVVSSSINQYDDSGYTVSYYGYGNPADNIDSANEDECYLDQSTGKLYQCENGEWKFIAVLPLVTDTLNSRITQTAGEIKSVVSSSINQYDKSIYTEVGSPVESGMSSYYELKGTTYIKTIDTKPDSEKTYYTKTSYDISYYGYGSPDGNVAEVMDGSDNDKYYLDQSSGRLYQCDNNEWSDKGIVLPLITENLQSQISQTANSIVFSVTDNINGLKSQIKANSDSITSKVTQEEVGTLINNFVTNRLGTEITQNAESVRVAWNKSNSYISLELDEYTNMPSLVIKGTDNLPIIRLNSNGLTAYENGGNTSSFTLDRDGTYYHSGGQTLGHIGVGEYQSGRKGLHFQLRPQGTYIGWFDVTTIDDGEISQSGGGANPVIVYDRNIDGISINKETCIYSNLYMRNGANTIFEFMSNTKTANCFGTTINLDANSDIQIRKKNSNEYVSLRTALGID